MAFGLCPHPQCLQQTHLLATYQRLICHQAAVKAALLVVAPNLGADGVGFSNCHWVAPASQAIDKRILAINPHPHLESAVVVAERWRLEQGAGLLLTPGLRLHY